MKPVILIVQAEGRGHLSQAIAMDEILVRAGYGVVRVFAGCGTGRSLPGYAGDHFGERLECFGSPGFERRPDQRGILVGKSLWINLFRSLYYLREARRLRKRIRESGAGLVINFYDVVGAIALRKTGGGIRRIGVGHHFLLHLENYPCPWPFPHHRWLLSLHTRIVMKSCDRVLALSFREREGSGKIRVVPPLVRRPFLSAESVPGDRFLAYFLHPGFIGDLLELVREMPGLKVDLFSELPAGTRVPEGITLHGLDAGSFLQKMRTCRGLITTSGFDTVAEAASMGLPLAVVPVPNHFEQLCNSMDTERSGLGVSGRRITPGLIGRMKPSPSAGFRSWVERAEELVLEELSGY